jgi:hypothetical protein
MSSIRVPISAGQAISLTLSQIPEEAKVMFRRGYSALAKLSDEKRAIIVTRSIECLEEGSVSAAQGELKKEIGLEDQDVESVLGAVMLLASSATARPAGRTHEDVPSELLKAKLVDPEDLPNVEMIFASLKKRSSEIETRVERSNLASRILPAYRRIQTAVDLRVESGDKRLAIAIGLVRIATDEDEAEIKFQVTSSQLRKIVGRLQDLQREIEEVEKLAPVWERK